MNDSQDNIIAIDGPAGSGKSTVAKLLAKRLGYIYVDTGGMYRALTLKALRGNCDLNNEAKLVELANSTKLDILDDSSGNIKAILDNEDVTSLIRTPEVTNSVSYLARLKGVREKMVENQRGIGSRGNCVFEGRDIGTVVFPKARYKFYVDADFEERVKRRYKELLEAGKDIPYEEVRNDLKVRDDKDMNRQIAPLKKAEDAVYIDTTDMTVNEVIDKLASRIKA